MLKLKGLNKIESFIESETNQCSLFHWKELKLKRTEIFFINVKSNCFVLVQVLNWNFSLNWFRTGYRHLRIQWIYSDTKSGFDFTFYCTFSKTVFLSFAKFLWSFSVASRRINWKKFRPKKVVKQFIHSNYWLRPSLHNH